MPGFIPIAQNTRWKTILLIVTVVITTILGVYILLVTQPPPEFYITMTMMAVVIILLWVGTRFISRQLNKLLPWKKYVGVRFFVQLILTILFSLLCLNLCYLAFKNIFTNDPPVWDQIIVMNIYGSLLILPVFSIYFGIHFLNAWKKSELEGEQFQKDSVKSQLQALRNHLDPHFLFNNLNILSSLIEKDKEQSKQFLEKFAEVYRNILQNELAELIQVRRELEFVNSYLYLIKIRFEEGIEVKIDIDSRFNSHLIPPLAIQMLIENSIKHNAITETKPLVIGVTTENNEYLVVTNNLQPKKKVIGSRGSGLENIRNRYAYFSDLPVIVNKTEEVFAVKIPLIPSIS